jgi:ATP/maltotriose-dependent transcriptional regulator MalT/DNA-binding SARP family transcriptional activator
MALDALEDAAAGGPTVGMTSIPVQPSKIQAPPLREETLARDRLLNWLGVKIHNRIVLLAAEAGYGKTTLLADFSRRTRVRMLWYRLDLSDRDPMVFMHHLVGAVRVRIPDGCSAAYSLLAEVGPTGPALDVIVGAFVRGLADLPDDPTALVLDDYHVVEDSPDIRPIVREILAGFPERLTLVFSSRKQPQIPIARLRAQGEVAELRTADLRFDESETERLFRDSYAMPLEPGIASELTKRTEGWAASLQLVQSAIRGRTILEVRDFVRALSGAEGDLYDYLAEEVVGELPEALQTFLMRTAVLETIDPEFGAVAAGLVADDVRSMIEDAERAGLLSRRGSVGRHVVRAHPLVRDFLLARLLRSVGEEGVAAIHRRVAIAAEPVDWALSARHFREAGDQPDVRRVLHGSIESVLASGAYATAARLLEGDEADPDAVTLVIRSREAMRRGDMALALRAAEEALDATWPGDFTALNAISIRMSGGLVEEAKNLARLVEEQSLNRVARLIARSTARMLECTTNGRIDEAVRALSDLIDELPEGPTHGHYRGVAEMDLAHAVLAQSDAAGALRHADAAIELLAATSAGIELDSARLIRARALAHLGRIGDARMEAGLALDRAARVVEAAAESAEIELLYGDAAIAKAHLAHIKTGPPDFDPDADLLRCCTVLLAIRENRASAAVEESNHFMFGRSGTAVAMETRRLILQAHAAVAAGRDAAEAAKRALGHARRQGADYWVTYGTLLGGLTGSADELSRAIEEASTAEPASPVWVAEAVSVRLEEIGPEAFEHVVHSASLHPDRWRSALRLAITAQPLAIGRSGPLLESIGTEADVPLLRSVARNRRNLRHRELGRTLARKVAPRVQVEDLGRVAVVVGSSRIEGTEVRRKVLALLCYLVTRPRFSATREEVMETLWPSLEPDVAVNSLNQTVYFLRRVFEPHYSEDTSPGYLAVDTETVWLDPELVSARSLNTKRLLRSLPEIPAPAQVAELQETYRGRFALDFAYEDWASDYRDSLHVGYLRVVESAIKYDVDAGHVDRAIGIAERALEIEPSSDELQAMSVRLHHLAGHYAAAAESYVQYSRSMTALGVEPPAIGDV